LPAADGPAGPGLIPTFCTYKDNQDMRSALASFASAPAFATDYSKVLTPARPDWPLAHPIASEQKAPPPFALLSERGVKPAYVPGLPGLPQGRAVQDDFGRKPLKYDAVFIRQSRVENGEVLIPPGGLAYLEDTWGGEVALRGEQVPVLGRLPTYIDYDMSIEVKENVTLPAGGSTVVGGQVYHYYATVGHERMANHTLHVRTIAGTDWEWAFGAPVLSETESGWWGKRFAQLYNQGQAREVSPRQMVFDWLSGVRMDRLLFADERVHAGLAAVGDTWPLGSRSLRVAAVDEAAGTVTLELLDQGKVTTSRTLGPVQADRLIEDTQARKALVFEDGDMVAFLSPWPNAFDGGKANLKVYDKAFSLSYGSDYARDPRFAVYPVGCPTGHNFGFMLVNKDEIRIRPGAAFDGPEGYFKVAVDAASGSSVSAWHVEDAQGNRSINLGGPDVGNVDLVLGQGRVAGQAILKDVGRTLLATTYDSAARLESTLLPEGQRPAMAPAPQPQPQPTAEGTSSTALMIAVLVMGLAAGAIGFELGRRQRQA
jgi:hypothetical protein